MFSLRRWRPFHLLLAWMAYWIALAVIGIGPGLIAAWRATRAGSGHGSIDAGFADGMGRLSVTLDGVTTWTGSASLGSIVFWIAVPPVLLWMVWLATRPRRDATSKVTAG